jgi:hypothetical protein
MRVYWMLPSLCFALSSMGVDTIDAQEGTSAPVAISGCYSISLGVWSRSLGANAAYHELPTMVRLDTIALERGGWRLTPDIEYPSSRRLSGLPRWIMRGDSIEMTWSNGFQPTWIRVVQTLPNELRGEAEVGSDANEFGNNPPRAPVHARRVRCAP